jgi:DNA repair exonuclease SbcCD nuclease subunit
MKPFDFVHIADTHLGYMQYNLPERREDFSKVFVEAVDKILQIKPSYAIFAGDIFNTPRPSNVTLATVARELRRLSDGGVEVFAVDGSHDMAPNIMTGTVLIPLHNANLVKYLPRLQGHSWQDDNCYIYGLRSFQSLEEADKRISTYFEEGVPYPKTDRFNILVFHGGLDNPKHLPPYIKPDFREGHLPPGFQYYAGGHIHRSMVYTFKGGKIVYPGCLETTDYTEADFEKGFFWVKVTDKEPPDIQRVKIEGARNFKVKEQDFSSQQAEKIVREATRIISELDSEGSVLVLKMRGKLPTLQKRSQIDVPKIKASAVKALYTLILNQMVEAELQETAPLKEVKELKTIAESYFLELLSKKHPPDLSRKLASVAVELLDCEEERARKLLEENIVDDSS